MTGAATPRALLAALMVAILTVLWLLVVARMIRAGDWAASLGEAT